MACVPAWERAFWISSTRLTQTCFVFRKQRCTGQLELELDGYHQYWCSAQKKGYSGTALFCKEEPLSVAYELPQPIHASEGRVIAAEFERFYLVNVYTPNSQRGLTRLDYRMEWEDAFLAYIRRWSRKNL